MSDENKDLEITEENTRPDFTDEASPEAGPLSATPDLLTHGSADSTEATVEAPGPVGVEAGQDPAAQPGDEVVGQDSPETDATAGDVKSPAEGAEVPDQGTLNLPATGESSSFEDKPAESATPAEPADLAGAPSAGKPVDASVSVVPTDAGFPVPKDDENEPPVHPTTGLPMAGDGLGEHLGKTADDVKEAAGEAPKLPDASATGTAKADEDAEGNNVAELEKAVADLTGRFDAIDGKLEALAKQLTKVLHKL